MKSPFSLFRSRTFGGALTRSAALLLSVAAVAGVFASALSRASDGAARQRAELARQIAQSQQAAYLRQTLAGRESLADQVERLVPNLTEGVAFRDEIRGAVAGALGDGVAVDIGSPAPHESVSDVHAVPFSIRGRGSPEAVRAAMSGLDSLPLLLRVIQVSIDVTNPVMGEGNVTISGEFFVRTGGGAVSG